MFPAAMNASQVFVSVPELAVHPPQGQYHVAHMTQRLRNSPGVQLPSGT